MSDPATLDGDGRYVFCVVNTADDGPRPDLTGIEDDPVRLIQRDGLGALVQSVDRIFDSTDLSTVRRWILAHQQVVETASETYGTVLPFRFDTILEGDDEVVASWIADHRETLANALRSFEGVNEYRIQLSWDPDRVRNRLTAEDSSLTELEEQLETSSDGKQYLIEKQYERQVEALLTDRKATLANELYEEIAPLADAITVDDSDRADQLQARPGTADTETETESVSKLSLLAPPSAESSIGEQLERFDARPALSVRFTGPWPPYTFAADVWEDA